MKKVPFTCSQMFNISAELTVTVGIQCSCLAAAAHVSAFLALNCCKMQFCTLLLGQHSNSDLASSAFIRKGEILLQGKSQMKP